ncbi:helix-turn-helix transcriptional regulator [Staphylococcus aureus]|uniref:helix-turn-helix domain-containing protein n=1 Tax=Staphylococcus aureus TaxID=1280 RepID=UPI0013A6D73E|nr:helix-turn-helix transcriptional regulator [Staphylococcus aureus]NDR23001.1 helix-turn-helix transcriptional regulator [Staphylococcus aureus]HDS3701815.1 helix-turn-helix transcriptional regulator [Staphylococcus aureus]
MKNNLSMLMGKERINASKLSKETGISRTTIYGLYHEKTESPDTKTVLTLCDYFGITLNEFLVLKKRRYNKCSILILMKTKLVRYSNKL